jgi:hypothetical protein
VVSSAADTIRSDFELRQTLTAAVPYVVGDPEAARASVDAATSMSSDCEHRQALDVLAESPGLTAAAVEPIARSAARIGSDFEKRQALRNSNRPACSRHLFAPSRGEGWVLKYKI